MKTFSLTLILKSGQSPASTVKITCADPNPVIEIKTAGTAQKVSSRRRPAGCRVLFFKGGEQL